MRGKTRWDPKRRRHIQDMPKQGYLAKALQSVYVTLKDVLSNSQEMTNACKVAKHCYENWRMVILRTVFQEKNFTPLVAVEKHMQLQSEMTCFNS